MRLTGAAKGTVLKLLADTGAAAARYRDATLKDLDIRRLQVDEIWAFCGMKQRNVPDDLKGVLGYGDVYTYVALDPASKLAPCWSVGQRCGPDATAFLKDLAGRMRNRVQLTTDGYRPYVEAVAEAFGEEVDYAQLVKLFATAASDRGLDAQRRYSPPKYTGAKLVPVVGDPETRLTNTFSRKVENLAHAVALHFLWYNFGRLHQRHRFYTPAQAAGVADHRWEIEEVVALLDSQRGSN